MSDREDRLCESFGFPSKAGMLMVRVRVTTPIPVRKD